MSPSVVAVLPELGLLGLVLGGVVLLGLLVGWSVVWWVDTRRHRRDVARQRLLLAHLYELEMACGGEFAQVGETVQYVRRLVLEQYEQSVVVFRAGLRARYGACPGPSPGLTGGAGRDRRGEGGPGGGH